MGGGSGGGVVEGRTSERERKKRNTTVSIQWNKTNTRKTMPSKTTHTHTQTQSESWTAIEWRTCGCGKTLWHINKNIAIMCACGTLVYLHTFELKCLFILTAKHQQIRGAASRNAIYRWKHTTRHWKFWLICSETTNKTLTDTHRRNDSVTRRAKSIIQNVELLSNTRPLRRIGHANQPKRNCISPQRIFEPIQLSCDDMVSCMDRNGYLTTTDHWGVISKYYGKKLRQRSTLFKPSNGLDTKSMSMAKRKTREFFP